MKCTFTTILATAGAILVTATAASAQLNILFYGNSFTQGSGGVQNIVRDIATAAGQPTPYVRSAAIGGWSLEQHLQVNTAVITTGIPPGQNWDFVVLQDYSTQPTRLGSTQAHRTSALALFDVVRAHSPGVNAVMYETWARAPGHSYFTGPNPVFPGGPNEMQAEVTNGYMLSTADINAARGAGTAARAPVGTAWQSTNWNNLHGGDLYHANNRGSLLAGLVLYSTIYNQPTSGLDLSSLLTRLSLTPADGAELTAVSDAIVPAPGVATVAGLCGFAAAARRRR